MLLDTLAAIQKIVLIMTVGSGVGTFVCQKKQAAIVKVKSYTSIPQNPAMEYVQTRIILSRRMLMDNSAAIQKIVPTGGVGSGVGTFAWKTNLCVFVAVSN